MVTGHLSRLLQNLCHVLIPILVSVSAQAPGDEDASCLENTKSYPAEWRMLLDSHNYESLLEGSDPAWQTLDLDGQGQGWKHGMGEACQWEARTCDFSSGPNQRNWFFTQYIRYEIATEVTVDLTYRLNECQDLPSCNELFLKFYLYETDTVDDESAQNPSNYQFIYLLDQPPNIDEVNRNRTIVSTGNKTGFHLGVSDTGTCGSIRRIIVYYRRCKEKNFPRTFVRYPSVSIRGNEDVQLEAVCSLENAEGINDLSITCYSDGIYVADGSTDSQCACSPGYSFNSTLSVCQACGHGYYKATLSNTDECLACPANSVTLTPASSWCQCSPGYIRPPSSDQCIDLDPPRRLRDASNSDSIKICWLPSLDALSFELSYGVYIKENQTEYFVKLEDIDAVSTTALTEEICYLLDIAKLEAVSDFEFEGQIEEGTVFDFLVIVHFQASLNRPSLLDLSGVEEQLRRVNVTAQSAVVVGSEVDRSISPGGVAAIVVIILLFGIASVLITIGIFVYFSHKRRSEDVKVSTDEVELDINQHRPLPCSSTATSTQIMVHMIDSAGTVYAASIDNASASNEEDPSPCQDSTNSGTIDRTTGQDLTDKTTKADTMASLSCTNALAVRAVSPLQESNQLSEDKDRCSPAEPVVIESLRGIETAQEDDEEWTDQELTTSANSFGETSDDGFHTPTGSP